MRRRVLTMAMLGVCCAMSEPRAEVAVIRTGGGVLATLEIFSIGAPQRNTWTPVRAAVDPALLLNPDGDAYADGPPSIVTNPLTRLPEAVWSYWDGAHYQIAWSRFDGRVWSKVPTPTGLDYEYLSADDRQNFDPK